MTEIPLCIRFVIILLFILSSQTSYRTQRIAKASTATQSSKPSSTKCGSETRPTTVSSIPSSLRMTCFQESLWLWSSLSYAGLTFMLIICSNLYQQAENCIDEWQTGEHVDVQFTATAYKHKFNAHLKQITEFEKKTQESDIIPRLLKYILKQAK